MKEPVTDGLRRGESDYRHLYGYCCLKKANKQNKAKQKPVILNLQQFPQKMRLVISRKNKE